MSCWPAGGIGHLFAITTNPPEAEGTGLGMAARAGAVIADPEFVQFHPTAIDIDRDPAPLATEALRGEGADDDQPDRAIASCSAINPAAELAPRDIVARAIYLPRSPPGRGAFLDCPARRNRRQVRRTRFPTVFAYLHGSRHRSPVTDADPRYARPRITTWAVC